VLISTGATMLTWILVPLVRIEAIEARVRRQAAAAAAGEPEPSD
jgi:hypothetical protein